MLASLNESLEVEDITAGVKLHHPELGTHQLFLMADTRFATFVLAVHSRDEVCVGGTRVFTEYDTRQAIAGPNGIGALSADMTLKAAAAITDPIGGMKVAVVLKDPYFIRNPDNTPNMAGIEMLGGELGRFMSVCHRHRMLIDRRCITGADVGSAELLPFAAAAAPKYVCHEHPGDFTAAGVLACQRELVRVAYGQDTMTGLKAVVVGAGGVGLHLIRRLLAEGVEVGVADTNERAISAAQALGAKPVPIAGAYAAPCDILAPCAYGGLSLHDASFMRCDVLAGAANNLFKSMDLASVGRRLLNKKVVAGRDFIVNAGGLLFIYLRRWKQLDDATILAEIDRIASANMRSVVSIWRNSRGAHSLLTAAEVLARNRLESRAPMHMA